MGYSIYIGERIQHEDGRYIVREVELEDAPWWPSTDADPDASGHTNGRHSSYTQQEYFARVTGLKPLFAELLTAHPGIAHLRREHLEMVDEAVLRWRTKHPDTTPGWLRGQDPVLAKLLWYRWWMAWALENCGVPSVGNW